MFSLPFESDTHLDAHDGRSSIFNYVDTYTKYQPTALNLVEKIFHALVLFMWHYTFLKIYAAATSSPIADVIWIPLTLDVHPLFGSNMLLVVFCNNPV